MLPAINRIRPVRFISGIRRFFRPHHLPDNLPMDIKSSVFITKFFVATKLVQHQQKIIKTKQNLSETHHDRCYWKQKPQPSEQNIQNNQNSTNNSNLSTSLRESTTPFLSYLTGGPPPRFRWSGPAVWLTLVKNQTEWWNSIEKKEKISRRRRWEMSNSQFSWEEKEDKSNHGRRESRINGQPSWRRGERSLNLGRK